jgi:hypothetical protein
MISYRLDRLTLTNFDDIVDRSGPSLSLVSAISWDGFHRPNCCDRSALCLVLQQASRLYPSKDATAQIGCARTLLGKKYNAMSPSRKAKKHVLLVHGTTLYSI